jgi:HlyD family secretion protein
MNSLWLKRIGIAVVAAAVIAGFAYALREKPVLADVGAVVSAPMKLVILQEGMARVRDVYAVSSPIAGHLARTVLDEGAAVRANATIVAAIHPLDPPLIDRKTLAELVAARNAARAALSMAELEYKKAQTDLAQALKDEARAKRLAKTGTISEMTLQRAENLAATLGSQVSVSLTAIELRQAELASAEVRLALPSPTEVEGKDQTCCVTLTAPVDGVVLAVYAKSEQPVAVGAKIADIGDPSRLEIVVDLLSSDAVRVVPGTVAQITQWGGTKDLRARVKRIDPSAYTKVSALGIEEQRVNAVLELEDTDPRLGHGFRVFAEIPIWESPMALQVPISALFRIGNRWNAFAVQGGRARRTELELGHMNDDTAEVLSGLSKSDIVVLHPNDTLEEGSLVEVREN